MSPAHSVSYHEHGRVLRTPNPMISPEVLHVPLPWPHQVLAMDLRAGSAAESICCDPERRSPYTYSSGDVYRFISISRL